MEGQGKGEREVERGCEGGQKRMRGGKAGKWMNGNGPDHVWEEIDAQLSK